MKLWARELRALGWLFGSDLSARVLVQVAILVCARELGPGPFGSLSAGLAALGLALVLSDVGVGDAAVRDLTGQAGADSRFEAQVTPLRIRLAIPWTVLGLVLFFVGRSEPIYTTGLCLIATPFVTMLWQRSLRARISLQFRRASLWAATLIVAQWFGALGGFFVGTDATSAAAGLVITTGLIALFLARPNGEWLRTRPTDMAWVRRGRPFLVTAGAVTIYSRGDRMLLALMLGGAAAGPYSAAYGIVMVAALAGAALHAALLPNLIDSFANGRDARWRSRAATVGIALVPAAGLLAWLAPQLMTVAYGRSYSSGADLLSLLSPLVVLYVVNPFLSSCLIASGRQRTLAGIAVVNLIAATVLYPFLILAEGPKGAAGASVLIEILGLVSMVTALSGKHRRFAGYARRIRGCCSEDGGDLCG